MAVQQKVIPPKQNIPFVDPSLRPAITSVQLLTQIVNLLDLILVGTGNPNGQAGAEASPGAIYLNQNGGAGTTLYVKESGVGTNTGWVGK